MANDTRPSRRSKDDDESTSSRKKGKGSSSSGSPTTESSGLRRSSRETPSRKQLSSSPSTMRKSDRLEKRTPTSTPVKRKSQIGEKQRVSSPLRRSDRGKKNPTLCSLGSKKFEKGSVSSDVKRKKLQREKSVKQLIMEGKESNGRGKQDRKPIAIGVKKKKRMDARTYTSLFKQQQKRYTGPVVHVAARDVLIPSGEGLNDQKNFVTFGGLGYTGLGGNIGLPVGGVVAMAGGFGGLGGGVAGGAGGD